MMLILLPPSEMVMILLGVCMTIVLCVSMSIFSVMVSLPVMCLSLFCLGVTYLLFPSFVAAPFVPNTSVTVLAVMLYALFPGRGPSPFLYFISRAFNFLCCACSFLMALGPTLLRFCSCSIVKALSMSPIGIRFTIAKVASPTRSLSLTFPRYCLRVYIGISL